MSEEKNSINDSELDNSTNNQVEEDTTPTPEVENEPTIEEQLANANAKIEILQDKYLRGVAEFDNYRKRTAKEKAELIKNGSADILTDILPFIDDLERAIKNSNDNQDFATLKEGVELIYSKLMHTLSQRGLEKISPKGEVFDTDLHEAIALIPSDDEALKGKVIDCARDGYKLNDRVLRHAQVAVAQ